MPTSQLLAVLIVFVVTLGDHAGVPNIYVIGMVLAHGKDFNPTFLFGAAFLSIVLYEQVMYCVGRWMRLHPPVKENRVIRYLYESTHSVSTLLSGGQTLWLIFGRFIAFVGLYVPFAAGQMGRPYWLFALTTTFGTVLQLLAFGIPAYLLGEAFHEQIEQIPLIHISIGIMALFVAWQGIVRYRRMKRQGRVTEADSQ
ncbi:MAG: hypothetical protein O3A46_09505 [Candidatus Poribacteria bacterium]|nr:hypothetical protein [Candidatus Poribacteria bacterium]